MFIANASFLGPAVIWNPYYSISSQCFGCKLKLFRLDDFLVASSKLFVGLSNIFPACERVGRLLWNINFRRIFRKFNYPHKFSRTSVKWGSSPWQFDIFVFQSRFLSSFFSLMKLDFYVFPSSLSTRLCLWWKYFHTLPSIFNLSSFNLSCFRNLRVLA